MTNKAVWQPGPKSTDAVAVVEAVDNLHGTFTIRLEDPSASDDEIASSFEEFSRTFQEQKHKRQQASTSPAPLDLQHAVPVQDQLEALGEDGKKDVRRSVAFQRYIDNTPHGASFTRTFDIVQVSTTESAPVPLSGGSAADEQEKLNAQARANAEGGQPNTVDPNAGGAGGITQGVKDER